MNPAAAPQRRDHVVVVGGTTTALRLVEELERAGEQVQALVLNTPGSDPGVVADMAELGAEAYPVTQVREAELRQVGVERARCVVVLGFDDVFCTRVALLVEELNPGVRLVLELSNPNFRERLSNLLGECVVLSSAQLAAPAFVAAGVSAGEVQTFELGGRMVSAGPRARVGGELLAVLGDSDRPGIEAVLPDDGDLVLGTSSLGRDRAPRRVRTAGLVGAIGSVFDRRLRWVLLGLLTLMVISVVYFRVVGEVTWVMAMYLALSASTLTGIGDTELPLAARFGGVIIQLLGLVLSSGITAVVVDALIKLRISDLTGGVRGKPHHHAVVCGLGRIGTSVLEHLHQQGIPVVGIEQREDRPGVLRARRLKIPVIIAEATDTAALEQAGIDTADAVLAVTDSDAVNLEIALVAKQAQHDVRVVTRLFDHDLAYRVERRLDLGPTRSVSMLAAPAFAAAAMGRRREVVYPVGRRVLLFTELEVKAGSVASHGIAISELARPGELPPEPVSSQGIL
ncbi:potassium transporter TrkA [Naumannella sp. ID2617S]|nr:potassium transporter TrkA [Naumannella sp. ID2617S]